MLIFAVISCGSAWWVIQFKVVLPLLYRAEQRHR
jgi:hypothetical protein